MANDKVVDALKVLRAEYGDAKAEVDRLESELDAAKVQLKRILTAVQSLEELVGEPKNDDVALAFRMANTKNVVGRDDGGVWEVAADVSERLAPYIQPNGRRLRSKMMLFDLLVSVGEPVTKDELRQRFFSHFGREDIERYWKRPENALNTAIERAVEDHILLEAPGGSGQTVYTTGIMERATGRPAMYSGEEG